MRYENESGFVEYTPDCTDTMIDDDGNEYDSDTYTLIDLVYIFSDYRGKGKAKILLQSALSQMSGEIKLCANPKENCMPQTDLVSFYERCGFSVCDTQGSDSVFMEIYIK